MAAEHIRMQVEARMRAQREVEKRGQQVSQDARTVAQGESSNQAAQLVVTVSECAARQVPFADDGSVPVGPTMVGAGQPVIPASGKFAGATPNTSAASTVFRTILPIRWHQAQLWLQMVPKWARFGSPVVGGTVGRWVPVVGWAWTGVSTVGCVAGEAP